MVGIHYCMQAHLVLNERVFQQTSVL